MGKHKKLTPIEIFLILAIIAVLVVWLFPRLLKTLDSYSFAIGTEKPGIEETSRSGMFITESQNIQILLRVRNLPDGRLYA